MNRTVWIIDPTDGVGPCWQDIADAFTSGAAEILEGVPDRLLTLGFSPSVRGVLVFNDPLLVAQEFDSDTPPPTAEDVPLPPT